MRWQSVNSEIHIVCETKKDSETTGSKQHSTEPTRAKTLSPRQLPSLRVFRCTLCTWHMHRDTLEVSDALQSQCTFLACGAGCCNLWLLKEILYAIARVTVLHIVLVVKTRMSRDNHVSQVGILIMSRLISYEIRYT